MQCALRVAAASLIVVAASFVIRADTPSSQTSEIQLRLGDLLFAEGKYLDSLDAYRNALKKKSLNTNRHVYQFSTK